MQLKRVPVESSNISSICYEASLRELEVVFKSGGAYVYEKVNQEVYLALLDAPSKGQYFHRNIKDKHTFRKGKLTG